jgi:pimeloyl-ACP methyl ester carboxylesterase
MFLTPAFLAVGALTMVGCAPMATTGDSTARRLARPHLRRLIRAVLGAYQAAGGELTERELADCGHSPHLEHPAAFLAALRAQIERVHG